MARSASPTKPANGTTNGHANGSGPTTGNGNGNGTKKPTGYRQLAEGEERTWSGLQIERRFTQPGVDPYDTVEWDTREAAITNEHGKVVFEQKDLEFPKSWSALATNVVASKYFRGPLGSPERENSVKQMIGRVADTITGWGRSDAYFATDADADTFHAELTDILLKQRAAFNSPVWFNVGIDEHPQCSACQPYHALVSTPKGMVPIGRLVDDGSVGTEVYDANGLTRIVAVKNNGQKTVRRIRLANGNFVEATPDHVVKAVRERRTTPEWLRVDQLEVGMRMHEHAHGSVVRERELALVGGRDSTPETARSQSVDASPALELEIVSIEELGVQEVYDIQTESGEYLSNNVAVHNCFINSVEDTMESILGLAKTEGMLFKFGSGTGSNLSTIRSSKEMLKGGGEASGPVSFMKGFDAFAGVIKSGGKTRRAAKMVILNADHPDVETFIDCKLVEEKKAWALIDAGYDGNFNGGAAYESVFFQNSNNSVRVTDAFMDAVERDADWDLKAVTSGATLETLKARHLLNKMAEAAWVCGDPGIQYHDTANRWNPVANTHEIHATNPCGEYQHIDDSACNLASLNLMRFLTADGEFAVEDFKHAVRIVLTAQEILVSNSSYPTPKITENSHAFRPLGIGYANLGALLMNRGLAYDSDTGRAYAGAITAVMQAEAGLQSARIARDQGGPFEAYAPNSEAYMNVMRMHRDAAYRLDRQLVPTDLLDAVLTGWDEVVALGDKTGFRNSQFSVLAPTGTISFLLDCDTTGVEPDIALIKYKRLVGGGYLKIVNQTIPHALKRLGYDAKQAEEIVAYIDEHETIEGAPHLRDEHLTVFDCAFKPANGTRSIHYDGHLKMMAATQPFISGAISKTVNMPEHSTPAEIAQVYIDGWKLGLKAIAVYRDNSKRSQPLNTKRDGGTDEKAATPEVQTVYKPLRRRLPDERAAITHKFNVGGHEGYLTIGLYEDGQPGEIFLRMAKEGSTISGLMDSFATAVSVAMQYGVPLKDLVNKFSHLRFEPAGFTTNRDIPMAKSLVDYIFRYMASKFMSQDEKDAVGIINRQMTLTDAVAVGESAATGTTPAGGAAPAAPTSSAGSTTSGSGHSSVGDAAPQDSLASASSFPAPAEGVREAPAEPVAETSGSGLLDGLKIVAQNSAAATREERLKAGQAPVVFDTADSPACTDCGSIMVRNGSCYKCINCGSTSGCS